jgi:hypothetical protein
MEGDLQCCGSESGQTHNLYQDPDPDPDPEKIILALGSSGSEMNKKVNYSEKLITLDNFSTKMLNLKI